MDYELIDREGYYHYMNRRDIADALRKTLKEVELQLKRTRRKRRRVCARQ
jgi:hypothetical protein